MRRVILFLLMGFFCVSLAGACSWAGRTTGKVVNNVERGADSFEKSYDKEREKKE